MKKLSLVLFGIMGTPCILSCTGDIEGFTGLDSSSTNIISSAHFSIGLSPINPSVIVVDTTASTTTYHGGIEVEVIATAGDRSNALVTSGTVYFETEYGLLSTSSCEIDATGTCSVTWQSELDFTLLNGGTSGNTENSITAYTTGEEAFIDLNGNDAYDNGETFFDTDEPYIDTDDDGFYAPPDRLIDIDSNGIHTPGDTKYNGSADCNHPTNCDSAITSKTIYDITRIQLTVVK